jgi:hypothetical protein
LALPRRHLKQPQQQTEQGMEISVTQALAELKLLRKRLDSGLEDARFVTMVTKKSMVDRGRFETQARASLQSYRDLLERYNRIKSAIVQSNATATVTIAGQTYTVAESVERKRSINYEETLLYRLQNQWNQTKAEHDKHQQSEYERVDRLIASELGKESKTNVDVVQALSKTFLEEGRAEIVDPLGMENLIRTMRKSIDDFTLNVDWTLSEANGRTLITV